MKSYFLGANTRHGFSSLYSGFPPRRGDYLRILKGGPGTGKSTLLKAVAAEAQKRELPAERVLCSGDPDSLDGVYLPSLSIALVDGTAPHAVEPTLFGVTGDYLDLGRHLSRPFDAREKQELLKLQERYREIYRGVYEKLDAAWTSGWNEPVKTEEYVPSKILEALPGQDKTGTVRRVFRSAITCQGIISTQLPEQYQVIPASPDQIVRAANRLSKIGWDLLLCPTPLDPVQPELLLLPEASMAFVATNKPSQASREPMRQAIELLRKAKSLHDEMEAFYLPHMDLPKLNKEAENQIHTIFPDA